MVSVAHSTLNFDGQVLEEGKELLVAIVKDSREKGFFIRMVDPEVGGAMGTGSVWVISAVPAEKVCGG